MKLLLPSPGDLTQLLCLTTLMSGMQWKIQKLLEQTIMKFLLCFLFYCIVAVTTCAAQNFLADHNSGSVCSSTSVASSHELLKNLLKICWVRKVWEAVLQHLTLCHQQKLLWQRKCMRSVWLCIICVSMGVCKYILKLYTCVYHCHRGFDFIFILIQHLQRIA